MSKKSQPSKPSAPSNVSLSNPQRDKFLGAVDSAIELRTKRGRHEVIVEHLDGQPWFGSWKASSITSSLAFPRSYRVNIRSLQKRSNICNCQDFALNQLGTCKHIEAVLYKIRQRDDYPQIKDETAPVSYVYLSWEVEHPPQILLHRTHDIVQELSRLLDDYFDASGLFQGRMPDEYFHFSAQVRDRTDLHLGEDATAFVQRLAIQASQKVHALKIREQIEASDGHLPGIKAKLYPYQVEGVAFLAANGRALLADDMGLGKTLQAVSASSWLMKHAAVERVLVICPASLKQQWAREIQKFTDYPVQVIEGKPAARHVQYRQGSGFFIINYELVLRDLSVINEALIPDLLILDEAQRIKNWRTKIASTIKQIPSRYAFVLTGTPLENRLEDLFSLMQVVDSDVLGPLWRYMMDFHLTDELGKVLGYRNLSELRNRLKPVMLRRDRRLVSVQLPKRIEQRLDVRLTEKQAELHGEAVSAAGRLASLSKKRPLTPMEQNQMMAALQRARMACNAAGLVDKETVGSPKLDEMENLIDELCLQSGLKAVVFSQWKLMTDMVVQRLTEMGVGFVHLHGSVPTHKRGELIHRFHEDSAVQVFVSTDAGGVGLNLQNASVVINLDMPWNPAILDQRVARVHRLGQKHSVQSILIVAEDSYEMHVMSLVGGKRDLFDNVVDPDASEDVVGLSKKLLDTLIEDLSGLEATGNEQISDKSPITADTVADETAPLNKVSDDGLEQSIQKTIESIKQEFGQRVEQILGSGEGLLIVLDRIDDDANLWVQNMSCEDIPVALIDITTLNSLRRLGDASPVKDTQSYYRVGDTVEPELEENVSPLIALAKEKLEAAEILLGQEVFSVASDLLINALLAAVAGKAGLTKIPPLAEAGIWIYTEALEKGWLNQEQVNSIMRHLAVVQAQNVPVNLLEQLLEDTQKFVYEVSSDG